MWINFILSGNNLTKGADKMKLPRHIGIIPDGNRRWAKANKLTTAQGHKEGAENLKRISKYANKLGIKYMTVYAFSTENST